MIIVISPSKTLDYESVVNMKQHSMPVFLDDSAKLIEILRKKTPKKLTELMGISDKLAILNAKRYQDFQAPFTMHNARQAIFAFKGDVYEGIDINNYSESDLDFAQKHLRILSGLYGLLKPLDLIQPYRLEMGIKLVTPRAKDLYGFWGNKITREINSALEGQESPFLINLASQEYFKAVNEKNLNGRLVNTIFKEKQSGSLKVIGLFAKQARGRMASFIIKNRIDGPQGIKDFNESGYKFAPRLSDDANYIFTRNKP
jgi:cytoplasmic iron level regulating protein YaaA (DUF328/UPF0246 family)